MLVAVSYPNCARCWQWKGEGLEYRAFVLDIEGSKARTPLVECP